MFVTLLRSTEDILNSLISSEDCDQVAFTRKLDLPTTTIVLHLKLDKVKPVKQQLSSILPEILLFLSKIR